MSESLKGKRILVFGLGLHGGGAGVARWLIRQGAKVTVTDLKSPTELRSTARALKGLGITFVLGKHRKSDIEGADMIIKNPGVPPTSPYLRYAQRLGIPVQSDLRLFIDRSTAQVCAVTGTKGKTTTTTLIWRIAKKRWPGAVIAGTAGVTPLEVLSKKVPHGPVILELSSWQLEDLGSLSWSPHIAVVTMIAPDHLNRHKSMSEYSRVKERIVKYQKHTDVAVLNADDPRVRKFSRSTKAKVIWFGFNKPRGAEGIYCDGKRITICARGRTQHLMNVSQLHVQGRHMVSNILAAFGASSALKIPMKTAVSVARQFRGIPSRMEPVAVKQHVTFINDTTATNPTAAIAAIHTVAHPLLLIAGGADKGLSYGAFLREVRRRVKVLIMLPGSATDLMRPQLRSMRIHALYAHTMREAVTIAVQHADPGDCVLLSPGCASFGLFQHEFDRGRQFTSAVKKLT